VLAGRFAAPYGLRLADHTAYIRRYLGYNLLDETYSAGVGYLASSIEVHATGFVYDPLQGAARKEAGGAILVEAQPGDGVLGASARASVAPTSTRLQAGVHAKYYLDAPKLLLQGELDTVREIFDGGVSRNQLAAYVGPVFTPTPASRIKRSPRTSRFTACCGRASTPGRRTCLARTSRSWPMSARNASARGNTRTSRCSSCTTTYEAPRSHRPSHRLRR
jgi:hypothetical protein